MKKKLRDFVAKWIMRVKQASSILRLFWWMVIGVSTTIMAWEFLSTLQTGLLITCLVGGTFLFAYTYDKTRTMREQAKKKSWRRGDFLGPKIEMRLRYDTFLLKEVSKAILEEYEYKSLEKEVNRKSEEIFEEWREKGVQ